jgi:hypothetical protein
MTAPWPVVQLWLTERARPGVDGRQRPTQVRQMVKRRAAKAEITKRIHDRFTLMRSGTRTPPSSK